MPRLDTKKCYLCGLSINILAGFVQLGIAKHAHLKCYTEDIMQQGVLTGRRQVLDEQEHMARAAREKEEDRAKIHKQEMINALDDMPRCLRCGRRLATGWTWEKNKSELLELAREMKLEVVEPSTGALGQKGICAPCVEAERIASNAAKKKQVVPEAKPEPKKEDPSGKEEPKPAYYRPIDLD